MSKLKYLLFISVLIVSCFSISCYASTSDSLYEQSLVESMIAQNGSNYESPFIAAGGNVELSDGNVNVNEVDLSLPGKMVWTLISGVFIMLTANRAATTE